MWVTASAVACLADWDVNEVVQATLWGLIRAARSEHPERSLRLLDIGSERAGPDKQQLAEALAASAEPELALRSGVALAARLIAAGGPSPANPSGAWRLAVAETGRLDKFEVVPALDAALGDNEVLLSVRAAGLNFRDVMTALGLVPAGMLGVECAGVVLAVGAAVSGMRTGERVMGMVHGSFGDEVRTDARLLTQSPRGSASRRLRPCPRCT